MKILLPLFLILGFSATAQRADSLIMRKIFKTAMEDGECYKNLTFLSKKIGHRISGSPQAEQAVQWAFQLMKSYKFDTVYLQECMVPVWVRGEKEKCTLISKKLPAPKSLNACALGSSVPTPLKGIEAEVVEIKRWEMLDSLGEKGLKGKLVFYNRPFDKSLVSTFEAYSKAVDQRTLGASRAAKYGAVGMLVRSMTTALDDNPHTGNMRYDESLPKIPGAALSTLAANELSYQLKLDPKLKVNLKLFCKTLPDAKSYNVIGEIKGREFPDEIIVVGGHLDSWDMGEGAHDDGAGCVQSIEVLRLFKELGLVPKRTIRAVLFMNEENGLRGGLKYAEIAALKKEKHLVAIESDRGGFTPRGFSFDTLDTRTERIFKWRELFSPYLMDLFLIGGSGADVGPLRHQGCLTMGYLPDAQRYFDYHHTPIDKLEAVNQRELEMGAAALAMMVFLISEFGLH